MNLFFEGDIVLYKGESYRVEVFNIFSRFADITQDNRSYLSIHESNLTLLFRGDRYYGEIVNDFYDDCLDRYNIMKYNDIIEIMKLVKTLECD